MKITRNQMVNLGLLALFGFLAAFLMHFTWRELPLNLEVGRIAARDIRADADYEIVDEEETAKLKAERPEAPSVVIRIRQGASIIRAGDSFEPRHLKVIQGILKQKAKGQFGSRIGGAFLFILIFIPVLYGLSRPSFRRLKLSWQDLVFNGVLLLITLSFGRLFHFFAGILMPYLPFEIPQSAFDLAIPVAAGAMLIRLVLPMEIASLFALVSAALLGILNASVSLMLFYLVEGIAAAALVAGSRSRTTVLKAGLWTGLINLGVLFSLDLLHLGSSFGPLPGPEIVTRLVMAFLGGGLSAMTVILLMPIFELAFNYLTPMKLLEYGSLNHPILREMIVQAPGTYHHSHMVGTLAEAACEGIGADSLFARVACYFHDIGKLKKSSYFIENQGEGCDRHSNLSPSMSALIISSHVKDGIEIAKEYKLPQRIIDIIPQHQGTKLISYFYSKAKKSEDPTVHTVDEREYRYPGPKPQTREAGVILLADTAEAATRALKDRSPARIEEVVRNMINKNFIDGQLDECELTLKDLNTIARSFVRILMGIYHQRIEYPETLGSQTPGGEKKVVELHGDKFTESKPLGEDSLREAPSVPGKDLPRVTPIRGERG